LNIHTEIVESKEAKAILSPLFENFKQRIVLLWSVEMFEIFYSLFCEYDHKVNDLDEPVLARIFP
jgi:hypothetical protein